MQVPHLGLLTDLSRVASGESRRSTVEHPFATLKYHIIIGHRRLFYVLVDERKRRSPGGRYAGPSLNWFGSFRQCLCL